MYDELNGRCAEYKDINVWRRAQMSAHEVWTKEYKQHQLRKRSILEARMRGVVVVFGNPSSGVSCRRKRRHELDADAEAAGEDVAAGSVTAARKR
jgi:hypothetical protein